MSGEAVAAFAPGGAPKTRAGIARTTRIGLVAVGTAVVLRIFLGNFVVNEFETWSVVASNAVAALIEGLLLWLVVFRLAVRRIERRPGTASATGAAVVGGLALASLAVPYSAHQPVLAAGAVALGLTGLERSEGTNRARAGLLLGTATAITWLGFVAYTVVTKEWPVG